MVTEEIVLGYRVLSKCLEVDKAKVEVIVNLLPPTNVKEVRSFLGHGRYYKRFIKDISKITTPLRGLWINSGQLDGYPTDSSNNSLSFFLSTYCKRKRPN